MALNPCVITTKLFWFYSTAIGFCQNYFVIHGILMCIYPSITINIHIPVNILFLLLCSAYFLLCFSIAYIVFQYYLFCTMLRHNFIYATILVGINLVCRCTIYPWIIEGLCHVWLFHGMLSYEKWCWTECIGWWVISDHLESGRLNCAVTVHTVVESFVICLSYVYWVYTTSY